MSCTKVHKGNLGTQVSIFDMGRSLNRILTRMTNLNEFKWTPSNDPPEQFYMGTCTTETKGQGRAGKMSCTDVHKTNLRS